MLNFGSLFPTFFFGIYSSTFACKAGCCNNKNEYPKLYVGTLIPYIAWQVCSLYLEYRTIQIAKEALGNPVVAVNIMAKDSTYQLMWGVAILSNIVTVIMAIVTWAMFCCGEKKSAEEKDEETYYKQGKVAYGYGNGSGMAPSYPGYGQQMPQPQGAAYGAVAVRAPNAPSTV